MYYFLIFVIIIFNSFILKSKGCECINEFNEIRNYLEANHPIYQIKLKDNLYYKLFSDSISIEISNDKSSTNCYFYIKEYLNLYNDRNLNLSSQSSIKANFDENNKNDEFNFINSIEYKSTESSTIDSAFDKYKTIDDKIEITFANDKTKKWDYLGIVSNSKSNIWKYNQIKYYFKKVNDKLWVKYLDYLHRVKYEVIDSNQSALKLIRLTKQIKNISQDKIQNENFVFFNINNSINYLKIPIFSDRLGNIFDDYFKSIEKDLLSTQYLILDLRGNKDGNESFAFKLAKLFNDNYIQTGSLEFWNSRENLISIDENMIKQIIKKDSTSKNLIFDYKNILTLGKSSKENTFISININSIADSTKLNKLPFKVIIFQDRNTSGAAEKLIAYSNTKINTITFGENTAGNLSYSYPLEFNLKCGNLLSFSSSIYKNFVNFEKIGIPAKVKLSVNDDWVEYAKKYIITD